MLKNRGRLDQETQLDWLGVRTAVTMDDCVINGRYFAGKFRAG